MNNETGLLISMLISLMFLSQPYLKKLRYWRWRRRLHLNKHQTLFDELYQDINGFQLSRQARESQDAFEYTYGEIDFPAFISLLTLIPIDQETIFYDLGSGVGKAVLAAAMVFSMKKCCGIELFSELHEAANQPLSKLQQMKNYQPNTATIQFIKADFLECRLDEATVIFIQASALFGESWEKLNQRFAFLIHCEYIISTSKPISCRKYQLIRKTVMTVSWGHVAVYIHKRKTMRNIE